LDLESDFGTPIWSLTKVSPLLCYPSLVMTHAFLIVLLYLVVSTQASVIANLSVYTDSACSMPYTNDTSWQWFGNFSNTEVADTYIGTYGSCITAPAPNITSGQVFCVTSTADSHTNLIYSMGAAEWTVNNSCSSTPSSDISYYFSGLNGTCARGQVTISGRLQVLYATYSCATGSTPNAADVSAGPLSPILLLMILASAMIIAL